MKRYLMVLVALAMLAGTAEAGWNFNFWGSNDKQHKNRGNANQSQPVSPQPVPEPGTILLLGSGLAALAAWRKLKR